MGEAKRRKLSKPNYGKPKFDPNLPNWVIDDEYDSQDPLAGTLDSCLTCAGVETKQHFAERLEKAVESDSVFLPSFSTPPNDEEYNRLRAIAVRTGEILVEERWTIKYSPEKAQVWRI